MIWGCPHPVSFDSHVTFQPREPVFSLMHWRGDGLMKCIITLWSSSYKKRITSHKLYSPSLLCPPLNLELHPLPLKKREAHFNSNKSYNWISVLLIYCRGKIHKVKAPAVFKLPGEIRVHDNWLTFLSYQMLWTLLLAGAGRQTGRTKCPGE